MACGQRVRGLGAAVELRYLPVPVHELHRRGARRNKEAGSVALTAEVLDACVRLLDAPTESELARFDPPVIA